MNEKTVFIADLLNVANKTSTTNPQRKPFFVFFVDLLCSV